MRKVIVILFAFWFIVEGSGANNVVTVVGPFNDKKTCDELRAWLKKEAWSTRTSNCWEGNK